MNPLPTDIVKINAPTSRRYCSVWECAVMEEPDVFIALVRICGGPFG